MTSSGIAPESDVFIHLSVILLKVKDNYQRLAGPSATLTSAVGGSVSYRQALDAQLSPFNGQTNVNIDTNLVINFPSPPTIGQNGTIRVFNAATRKEVDMIDLSIPFSPSPYGNGSTKANYSDTTTYQTNIIGGMDFYFFPILVRGNSARIYLHNNMLEYGQTYYVKMDPGVLSLASGPFAGFNTACGWSFSTKSAGPPPGTSQVLVAADGSADFNTVQGAIDWAPISPSNWTTIVIQDGDYEELVYFQYKTKIWIRGESRNGTRVGYPNNSAFNPPNRQGPSRRPAFSFKGVSDIQLSDFSITNYYRGQAEALLSDGMRIVIDNMRLNGSGDAVTTYGTLYARGTTLYGDGDSVLGYASVFWDQCVVDSGGAVTWTRTVGGIHGNVFVNSTIIGRTTGTTFARLPNNKGGVMPNWPHAEMVLLNTRTQGIDPVGWGPVQGPPFDTTNVHFWEFNTMDINGNPVDMSSRLNISQQLTLPSNESTIAQYMDPAFILGGWTPTVLV
ncbi:pectinesterase [Thozetella sp. PMI_491]|nr:pectinesterase [Thozetella sp. PMI_491]